MSSQIQLFANLIKSAKDGREQAVSVLRTLCSGAAEAAPQDDLIQIAEFLYELRMNDAKRRAGMN